MFRYLPGPHQTFQSNLPNWKFQEIPSFYKPANLQVDERMKTSKSGGNSDSLWTIHGPSTNDTGSFKI